MNRAILIGVLVITAMHAFDELVLIIALPAVAADLGSAAWYGLIIAAYVLASVVGMSWAGPSMDRMGPLPVLGAAGTAFVAGLVLAALSWNTAVFVIARILQGIGGGIGWTIAFGLISLACPDEQKPRAIAAMDVAWVFPAVLAPIAGGYLVDYLHWRWIFVLQIPPLLLAILLIAPRIRQFRGHRESAGRPVLGNAVRLALGSGTLLYLLGRPPDWLWLGMVPALWLAARPFNLSMPPRWWRMADPLSTSLVCAVLAFLVFYGMQAYQPLYLIEVSGLSTQRTGLILTCASLLWMIGSLLVARNHIGGGPAARLLLGMSTLVAGILLLGPVLFGGLDVNWAYPAWAVAGLGMGITFNTSRATAMAHTAPGQHGFVATAISLCASMGLSFATGIGGAIKNQMQRLDAPLDASIQGIWCFSVLLSLLALVLLGHYYGRHSRTAPGTAE